jgi:alpha-L-fucosidase
MQNLAFGYTGGHSRPLWQGTSTPERCISRGEAARNEGLKFGVSDHLGIIVSRNGNFLLNFPLPTSGELDLEEQQILAGITEWMTVNREAIFATRL